MKALQFVIFLLLTTNMIGQIAKDDLKGEWILVKHQATSGPNDTVMMVVRTGSPFQNLTLFIDDKIYLDEGNQTMQHSTQSMFQDDCNFQIRDIEEIKDVDRYLFSTYMVKPIQLSLDEDVARMMIIYTSCEDEMFDNIFYFKKNIIGLHKLATFFIFERKEHRPLATIKHK